MSSMYLKRAKQLRAAMKWPKRSAVHGALAFMLKHGLLETDVLAHCHVIDPTLFSVLTGSGIHRAITLCLDYSPRISRMRAFVPQDRLYIRTHVPSTGTYTVVVYDDGDWSIVHD